MASEKTFELKVRKYLEERGAWVLKTWGGGMQRSGIPDLLVCLKGIFFGIELKADKGKPSDLQRWNVSEINRSGGIGIILYPAGFEEFRKLVEVVLTSHILTAGLRALRVAHSNSSCVILTDWHP